MAVSAPLAESKVEEQENLEKLEAEIKEPPPDLGGEFKAGSNYLGRRHHPALGIRIPEIVLPGIINALQKHRCAAGLMLSFGRETAPEEIIQAPPGRYEITLGHTGTSIRKYLTTGARAARAAVVPVEMEADHLIITVSSAQAVKRIEGVKNLKLVGQAALEKSLRYNLQALDEAAATNAVRAFTTDTSDLFDESAERLRGTALTKAFADVTDYHRRQMQAVDKRCADLKGQQDRLLNGYLSGIIDEAVFQTKSAELKCLEAEVRESGEAAGTFDPAQGQHVLETFDFSQKAAEEWRGSNNARRREIIEAVSLNRAVSDVSLCVQKRKPFDILAERPSFVDGRGGEI